MQKAAHAAEVSELARRATKTIRVSGVEAHDLPDADKGMGDGSSDPYMVFRLCETTEAGDDCLLATARTTTIPNSRSSIYWDEELLLEVPGR